MRVVPRLSAAADLARRSAGALTEAEREVAEGPEDGEDPGVDRVPQDGAEVRLSMDGRAVVAEQEEAARSGR